MNAPTAIYFDLNALVPNLQGAFHEGVSAAFRMFDLILEEDVASSAVGKPYPEAIRTLYCDELGFPAEDEERMAQLCAMYEKVVRRFVQFSGSLFPSPRTAMVLEGLKKSGHTMALCTELDATSLGHLTDRLGWDTFALFDAVITGEGVETKDDLLSDAISAFAFQSEQSRVFVGAQPDDVLPAKLFGCDRVLIRDAADAMPPSDGDPPAFVSFHSMTDLTDLLRSPSVAPRSS